MERPFPFPGSLGNEEDLSGFSLPVVVIELAALLPELKSQMVLNLHKLRLREPIAEGL
ncbi:MAG: hypothetical protein WCH37_07560 [Synechococcaceae cyanobacterium ELA182]